jgi:hypothetical protein
MCRWPIVKAKTKEVDEGAEELGLDGKEEEILRRKSSYYGVHDSIVASKGRQPNATLAPERGNLKDHLPVHVPCKELS